MTSLDDLLSQDGISEAERPGGRSRRARTVFWALKAGSVSAGLAGGLVLALHLVGFAVSYPLAFGGFFALAGLHRSVRALRVVRPRLRGGRLRPEPSPEPADGLAVAVGRWQAWLRPARTEPADGATRPVQSMIAELVDERLRQRHGVSRATDPARARTLLGEKLWSYLAKPAARTPSARDLAAMLTTVEKL